MHLDDALNFVLTLGLPQHCLTVGLSDLCRVSCIWNSCSTLLFYSIGLLYSCSPLLLFYSILLITTYSTLLCTIAQLLRSIRTVSGIEDAKQRCRAGSGLLLCRDSAVLSLQNNSSQLSLDACHAQGFPASLAVPCWLLVGAVTWGHLWHWRKVTLLRGLADA